MPGDWVEIRRTILSPDERAPGIPVDTQKVPLIMIIKGYLEGKGSKMDLDLDINSEEGIELTRGDLVRVRTETGRLEEGAFIRLNPGYSHGWGSFIPEIQKVGHTLSGLMEDSDG
ncbi:MAG: 2-amino-4-ketopentanoate thiolase [Spirochaetales bacterium]|nr:2-amino-4-ketopentanoate thiolase [Spirochaetales bacterium]